MATPHTAADPWAQLSELWIRAYEDDTARIRFGAALRDFHGAGWTYRQLGLANAVSHEFVRLAILGLPKDAPASAGIDVPQRPKPLDVIPLQELDPRITEELKSRLAAAVEADPAQRTPSGIKPGVADYFAALCSASDAGWDAYSIASALGSHPKAVFKFIAQQERYREGKAPAVAAAPHRGEKTLWRASRPALPLVEVAADDVQELHRLEPESFGETAADATAINRYLSLLGAWYLIGANREELERATGQHWETVRKRLVRGGYMAGKPRSIRLRQKP